MVMNELHCDLHAIIRLFPECRIHALGLHIRKATWLVNIHLALGKKQNNIVLNHS